MTATTDTDTFEDPFEDLEDPTPPTTRARFTSECAGCCDEIQPGDPIRYDESHAGWTGVDCCGEDYA